MDKQAYHYNKKKMKGKTPGMYRYFYPCDPADKPDCYLGSKAYAEIEVTEREWQILYALDEKEYNADHAYARKFTPLLYAADEQELPPKERNKRLDKKPLFDESSDNETDISRAMKILNEQERKVYAMIHFRDMRQKDAAEQLGVTQGYISMVLEQAEEKIAEYDGDRSPDGVAWRYWKRFVKKGYMPDHVDVEIEYALFQLSADLSVFLHWFYSASELIRFATKLSLRHRGRKQAPQGGETRTHAELHLRHGNRGLQFPLSHEKGRTARLPNQERRSAHQRRRDKARQLLQVAQERRRYGRFAGTSLFRPAKIRACKH